MKMTSRRKRQGETFVLTAIAAVVATSFGAGGAYAQEAAPAPAPAASETPIELEEIQVTGTRIVVPGVISASPIVSVDAEEISLQQQPEVERILRLLPSTAPDDGSNVNNGSAGVATVNLRGLGPQRNLVLINGKRLTPYNIFGLVDTSTIPTAMIERVDIVTGGASAVYGSDAMSGVINFIMKRDFEGIELNYTDSLTEEGDGRTKGATALLGGNFADGRGNMAASLNWSERDGVLLGQRQLGTLGIVTADGSGLSDFNAGLDPAAPPAGCDGPNAVAATAGGSTTTLPTRVAIAGGPGLGQFRNDGTLAGNCSRFNFNPFNYYQTPLERYGGSVLGRLELNPHAEAYTRLNYSNTRVRQQVAPSGLFGDAFFTPMNNPLIGQQARTAILAAAEAGRVAGTVSTTGDLPNWVDVNTNNVVDAPDRLLISYRRRTVEFGERSTTFNNTAYQFVTGVGGNIMGAWNYDVSFQRGWSDRTNVNAGYTNVTNVGNALDSTDGVTCANGDTSCVPINLFGGFGAITPAMAAYSSASAIEKQYYVQNVLSATVTGLLPDSASSPFARSPIGLSFGVERRRESGETVPDECLKLAPASCLGGAGGNTLPISGGFSVNEIFTEAILPLVDDKMMAHSLSLELGYRYSDYDPSGVNKTWKYGLNWEPVEGVMFRAMQQRAARAPNVGELAAPTTASLQNATSDPCSIANAANLQANDPNDAALRARCLSTGMTAAQVGTVEDLVSGQINTFSGTNLLDLPQPEKADTTTVGFVFTPKFGGMIRNPVLTVDYYNIKIKDYINTFQPQEILDACYLNGLAPQCATIRRVGGTLTLPGSGIETFTTNLNYLQAEGIEVFGEFGLNLGNMGGLKFMADVNNYLTQESQSSTAVPVLDCRGFYSTSCGGPLPKVRWIQRTTWEGFGVDVSYLWRFMGSTDMAPDQVNAINAANAAANAEEELSPGDPGFHQLPEEFKSIDAYSYFDLSVGYKITNKIRIAGLVTNVFDKDPPVLGNEAADTGSNSGNTFPSHYDTLGRVFSVSVNIQL